MTNEKSRLSFSELLVYGVGQTGNQVLRDVPSTLLLFYMTNARMIPPSYAGFAILLPKIWVVIADPLVGMLSDRTQGRWGARKPFLFAGALLSGFSFCLLFACPTPSSPALATLVVGILYLLVSTGFSLYSVPYLALAVDLSPDPAQRTRALGAKQAFALVGVMGGLALAPWLLSIFGNGPRGYLIVSLTLGIIVLVTMLATALLVPVHGSAGSQAIGGEKLLARFAHAFAHRPFRIMFAASTSQLFGFGTAGASAIYYVVYVSQLPLSAFSGYIVAACAGAAIAQPLWVALAGRIGNLTNYRLALFGHIFPALLFLMMPPDSPNIFYLIGFISGTTTMGSTLLSFAMLVEVIALDGPDSTRKGLFAAIYTAMEKVMIACGGFCVAIILSLAHFSAATAPLAQPPAVHVAILVAFIGVQVATLLFSLLLLARYNPGAHAVPATA